MFLSTIILLVCGTAHGAIVPNAAGQIGINPVNIVETQSNWVGVNTEYLTLDPASYVGSIGPNTDVLTTAGTTTKWIGAQIVSDLSASGSRLTTFLGVNTDYLTESIITTTVAGTPTAVTNAVAVSIVGPTAVDGSSSGDTHFLMSPALVANLQSLADEFCGGGGKLKKQAGRTCSADFLAKGSAIIWATGDPNTPPLVRCSYLILQ